MVTPLFPCFDCFLALILSVQQEEREERRKTLSAHSSSQAPFSLHEERPTRASRSLESTQGEKDPSERPCASRSSERPQGEQEPANQRKKVASAYFASSRENSGAATSSNEARAPDAWWPYTRSESQLPHGARASFEEVEYGGGSRLGVRNDDLQGASTRSLQVSVPLHVHTPT